MPDNIDAQRRALLRAATVTLGALGAGSAAAVSSAQTTSTTVPPAFANTVQVKPLSFDPARLNGLSERLLRSHWENNYGGSVKALATIRQQLAEALAKPDTPPFVYDDLKREHLLRTGSVILHEYYFDNLGGNGEAGATQRKAITDAFGSFDVWETEFRHIGMGLAGGSGWVVLGFNTHFKQIENYWLADHAHSPAATIPLLVMDMYEHSYQMDFGAAAAKYIDAFFSNIRWETVAQRLTAALSTDRA